MRWKPAGRGLVSIGRLTNVSLSGGFIADFDLRVLLPIEVALEVPGQPTATAIPAYVTRRSAAGSGIEWFEWAPLVIRDLLTRIAAESMGSRRARNLQIRCANRF